ncbi:MAG: fumarylacetoacetate hydrolase family protein [Lentilitoribacter sp.]
MDYIFNPAPQSFIPIEGSDQAFPVRRVYCVGRNYAEHAREMGHDPDRDPPFFFQKNPNNLLLGNSDFPYPPKTKDVHHEIELVVGLKKGGTDLSMEEAKSCIFGYAVGIDMTRRDLQGEMKKLGRPWEIGKAFEHSAPCTNMVPLETCGLIETGDIWLDVNGERKQTGKIEQMIWNIEETISYLSGLFELAAGDIIMTGTPAGVGPVQRGDLIQGFVEGVGQIDCKVV